MVDFGVVLVERLVEFIKNPSRECDVNALSMFPNIGELFGELSSCVITNILLDHVL